MSTALVLMENVPQAQYEWAGLPDRIGWSLWAHSKSRREHGTVVVTRIQRILPEWYLKETRR